jgi:redox-sensing transcriptional repressor
MDEKKQAGIVSIQALHRMPFYLEYLKKTMADGTSAVSAPAIAKHFKQSEIQVRKDLAAVSTAKGKPKSGFDVRELIYNMEELLGYHNVDKAVLAGVGSLGKALLSYDGFGKYGIDIVSAFDVDEKVVGSEVCGKMVLHSSKLSELCRRMQIHIGIIAVPADKAQVVCDQMIAGGIKAILNYAPIYLYTSDDILVRNDNIAASLALMSEHLREKMGK